MSMSEIHLRRKVISGKCHELDTMRNTALTDDEARRMATDRNAEFDRLKSTTDATDAIPLFKSGISPKFPDRGYVVSRIAV